MADLVQNTDHEGATARFTDRWRNKADLDAWTKTYLKQLQDLEDAIFEVILGRILDNAIGVQLDIIGKLVGQPRTDASDDRYRTLISARIRINRSSGTPEDLIGVAVLLLATNGESFKLREEPPAQVRITVLDELQSSDPDLFHSLLNSARAAGVRLLTEHNTQAAVTGRLRFGDSGGATVDGGTLASTVGAPTNPGALSSVIG